MLYDNRSISSGMALYTLHCADVPLRNCSLAHNSHEFVGIPIRQTIRPPPSCTMTWLR